jgi:hypothetical protein
MLLNIRRPLIQLGNYVCEHMQVSDLDNVHDLLEALGSIHSKRQNSGIGGDLEDDAGDLA